MTPNSGFKVTGYLKVEYLADGARVFNCTKHSYALAKQQLSKCVISDTVITRGQPKTLKKLGIVAEFFLLKALEGVLHQ